MADIRDSNGSGVTQDLRKMAQKTDDVMSKVPSSVSAKNRTENISPEKWRYKKDGTPKTFDELSTPEVLTWISTLPQEQQGSAAAQFESEYLKNPGSNRYDPYYTQYSNNDAARQMFGVDTFDQTWIDNNRGYAQYVTFSDEGYTTPKKPGKNASEQEQKAYQWWLIANTYEQNTQAAEQEYTLLRGDIQRRVQASKDAGEAVDADAILREIDWGQYKTLSNLREVSAAGNARMLNRPVRVGDESLRSMINAAGRGEDITQDRDWVMGESEYMRSRSIPETVLDDGMRRWTQSRIDAGYDRMTSAQQAQIDALEARIDTLPEGSEERRAAEWERASLILQMDSVSSKAAAEGNRMAGRGQWDTETLTAEAMRRVAPDRGEQAAQNKERAQAALASQQAQQERIEAGRAGAETAYAEKIDKQFGERKEVNVPTYNEYVGSMRSTYGLPATLRYINGQVARLEINEEQGTLSDEEAALLEEYRMQLTLLENEQDQRALIEQQVMEEYKAAGYRTGFGPLTRGLWEINYRDAINDGDKVPLDQYEDYLLYRLVPGSTWGDETIRYRENEMSQYDETSAHTDRAKLLAAGIEEGSKSVNTAIGMGAAENVMYWIKSRQPEYQGLTREEIYAIDHDLQTMRAWNGAFEGSMDPAEKQALSEKYPVFALVSAGITEVMKMGNQSAVGGVLGNGLQKLIDHPIMRKVGGYLPYSLDAFSGMFETALSEGATADQAMLAGALNGAISGPLSSIAVDKMTAVGGRLFGRLLNSPTGQRAAQSGLVSAVKNGWGGALLSLLGTAAGEGAEEAVEEVIGGGIAKTVYDRDRAWYGEGGVIDPQAMLQSGLAGAVAGGMFPIASGIGGVIDARRQSRQQAAANAEIQQRVDVATQHIFEIAGGLSGELGEAALEKATDMVVRLASGDIVEESEYDELRQIMARSASVEDAAEELVGERAAEIETAKEEAARAEEAAQTAAQEATEAQAELDGALATAKPMVQALNDGTASYDDPEMRERLTEAHAAAKSAKGRLDKGIAKAQDARRKADEAAQGAADTEARIRAEARTRAQAQVDAEMQREAEQEASAAKDAVNRRQRKKAEPGVRKSYSVRESVTQRGQLRILDALGREYGITFDVVDSIGGGISAMYDRRRPRLITVAMDASEGAILQAGAHEMVHYIRSHGESYYQALQETVLAELGKKMSGEDLETLISDRMDLYKQRTGQELTREDALEEIVAEAVPTIFTDESAVAELVREQRTLVEEIRDFFIRFANKVREIAERYWEKNDRYEIAALIDEAESLREIAYMLDQALDAASGNESDLREDVSDVLVYPSGDEDARLQALNGLEGVRFSVSGSADTESEDEGRKAQRDLAGKIVRKYKSDIRIGKVRRAIAEIEDAYNTLGDEAAAEEAAARIAREIAESSRSAVSKEDAEEAEKRVMLREQYADTREMLREKGISLTDVQKEEAANSHGSYNDWRRSMMGNVLIKNDGVSLDAVWSELSAMHPEMFPADTNEGDMVSVLTDFIEQVRPGRKIVGDMDAGAMAAAISLELQGAVLSAINREAEAVAAETAAAQIMEKGRQRTALKREAQREAKRAVMREIAEDIRAAREAGDDTALKNALGKYREKIGNALQHVNAGGIIELGIEIRAKEQEIARLKRQAELLKQETGIEGLTDDLASSIDRARLIEDMVAAAEYELRAMHRQQMVERGRMRIREMDEDNREADPMIEMAYEIAAQDLKDSVRSMSDNMREHISRLSHEMRTKQKDYSQISTLTTEDIDGFFGDVLGEMQQNSVLAREYEQSVSGWRYQLESDQMLLTELRRAMDQPQAEGDEDAGAQLNAEISSAKDRIDVLKSRIKHGEAQAKNFRRMGAQSAAQALREGRLAQPIMERVLAMCIDAHRQNNWFNKLTVVKDTLERGRLEWTTAARVWDDLFGNAAPVMRAIYYDPIMDNETERQRWIKGWRDKIAALKLTKSESEMVQRIGEGRATLEEQGNASAKVLGAIEVFRAFYDEAYDMAARAMERNGYPKPGHRSQYFPHIDKPDTIWEKLGIHLQDSSLPTSINGLTETFSPGRQYSGRLGKREGERTDFDALYGFEDYLSSMSNVIYHTDDIQRLRQLESEIRAAAEQGVFFGGKKTTHLSEFVKWIHEYTNQLAGKKSVVDRAAEGTFGRNVYRTMMGFKSVKGSQAVAGNIASALTNFIPVTQAVGEVVTKDPMAVLKAVGQEIFNRAAGQSNLAKSSYIVRRFGSDSVNQSTYQKVMNKAGWLFGAIDKLSTELVVNMYYQHNLDMGMDSETAMRSADSKAARLMGDRSKGAMPTAYGSQVLGLFTQFQYEVANQSQHFRKDIWRGSGGLKEAFMTLLSTMIFGNVWNYFAEQITGRRSAADPLYALYEIYQVWRDKGEPLAIMQSVYNNASDIFPYMSAGGRLAAFETFADVWDALMTEDATFENKAGYVVDELVFGLLPMGGQVKKTLKGMKAVSEGGMYSASGEQLRYPLEWSNFVQASIFGPAATPQGRAYYAGDAPGLSKARTEAYEIARGRGYSSTEAYTNEAARARSKTLDTDAKEVESTHDDALARMEAGLDAEDVSLEALEQAEQQREEARGLREDSMPVDLLSDYWWARRNKPEVKAGVELWRMTGAEWALPVQYNAETKVDIDGKPRYAGDAIGAEAAKRYAEGYTQIMRGVDVSKLDEAGMAKLQKDLTALKSDTTKWIKAEIQRTRGK